MIYVFDLDGTLIDSMGSFAKGILKPADDAGISYDENLVKILTPLGYTKSAEYYVNKLGLSRPVSEIVKSIEDTLYIEYSENILTKAGVPEYLRTLHEKGARLFVLTASPHMMTDVCLKRHGLFNLFEKVWSVDDFGLSKSGTELFFKVADEIGCAPSEIHYFDDSLIALKNAKRAGYKTYAVYDSQNEEEKKIMKEEHSVYVGSFTELL